MLAVVGWRLVDDSKTKQERESFRSLQICFWLGRSLLVEANPKTRWSVRFPLPISPELLHSPGGKLITSSRFNFSILISADDFYSSISGHTAVNVGKSMVVVFGGLVDKKFLNDIIVYDIGKYHTLALGLLFPWHCFKYHMLRSWLALLVMTIVSSSLFDWTMLTSKIVTLQKKKNYRKLKTSRWDYSIWCCWRGIRWILSFLILLVLFPSIIW